MPETLRLGVVGLGSIGKVHARNIAYKIKNVELTALCDINTEVVRSLAKELNVDKVYYDYTGIVSDPSIDALVIAVPTYLKKDIVIRAANAGKHLFIEKPLALNLEDAKSMIDTINKARVKALVGYQRRYDRAFIKAREIIQAGKLGNVLLIRSWTRDPPWNPQGWAADPNLSGGRPLDSSSHDFDVIRYLTNAEVTRVYAEGSVLVYDIFKKTGDFDHMVITLRLNNGAIGIVEYSGYAKYGYDVGVEVLGTEGRLMIGMGINSPITYVINTSYGDDHPMSYVERFSEAYLNELISFINMIRFDEKPLITLEDAYKAIEIALAVWDSLRKGMPIDLVH